LQSRNKVPNLVRKIGTGNQIVIFG